MPGLHSLRAIPQHSYQSLVRPILEYPSTAWDHYTQPNINKLESVQRRAAGFVTGDYRTTSSVSDMITNLGWETLQQRRTQAKQVHTRPYRHPSHNTSPSSHSQYKRTLRALPVALLQDRIRLWNCRHSANLGDLQGRAALSLLVTSAVMFLSVFNGFYQLLTTPQMHLENSAPERALYSCVPKYL